MATIPKEVRLNIRATAQQKAVITKAAALKQSTASHFILKNAYEAACEVLASQTHFALSEQQWNEFCQTLDASPKSIPSLKKLLTERGVFDA